MKVNRIALLAVVLSVGLAACGSGATQPPVEEPARLVAFPGAEGFGAVTTHGRGGQVIKVTNLNDAGPGSLRAAVEGSNRPARIVILDVGGIIQLNSPITIRSGNLYIAGQSAPGDGITLKGAQLSIQASDVVVRHLRSRPGDELPGAAHEGRDGIQIVGSATRHLSNIIVDHVSTSWGVDENMSVWPGGSAGRIENVTIQWSIISEALLESHHPAGRHSMGLLIGEGSRNITLHHNLFAHNNQRNPRIKQDVLNADIVNNVFHDWGEMASEVGESAELPPTTVNFVKNYWKRGPSSPPAGERREVRVKPLPAGSGIYFEGNIGPSRTADSQSEWSISDISAGFVSASRFPAQPVTEQTASAAYELVLNRAGAIVPIRDAVDQRVVQSVREGTGRIIDSQAEVGAWPNYPTVSRPANWDTDGDGIPDAWEMQNGLDPDDPSDGNRVRPDGYTNLEWYLHWLTL